MWQAEMKRCMGKENVNRRESESAEKDSVAYFDLQKTSITNGNAGDEDGGMLDYVCPEDQFKMAEFMK